MAKLPLKKTVSKKQAAKRVAPIATKAKPATKVAPKAAKVDPKLAAWLAPKYRSPSASMKTYTTAKPFPHVVLPRIFAQAKADALREAILNLANNGGFTHKESDLFSLAQTADLNATTDPAIKELRDLFASPEWRAYLTALTGVPLAGGALDIGGSLYQDTDFLLCHDDQVAGRRLAYVYYLGPDFTPKEGGALTLLNTKNGKPGTVVHRYPPKYNTLALFTVSDKSWHAVEEVLAEKPRLSINGWFH